MGQYELGVDFQTYLQWIVDMPNKKLNEHFSPMIVNAQPCTVNYNFYANFKRLSSEMHLIMKRLGIPSEYYHDEGYYETGQETETLLPTYYSQVSTQLKKALFSDFHAELDFYYHLFPEDRKSHITLLGIQDSIL